MNFRLNRTSSIWDRNERIKINDNWDMLEALIKTNGKSLFESESFEEWLHNNSISPKPSVPTVSDLPTNPTNNEIRGVEENNKLYIYDGDKWIDFATISFDEMQNISDALTLSIGEMQNIKDTLTISLDEMQNISDTLEYTSGSIRNDLQNIHDFGYGRERRVNGSFQGATNMTKQFNMLMDFVSIINFSSSILTLKINDITIEVPAETGFSGSFKLFNKIEVTATGYFSGYVSSKSIYPMIVDTFNDKLFGYTGTGEKYQIGTGMGIEANWIIDNGMAKVTNVNGVSEAYAVVPYRLDNVSIFSDIKISNMPSARSNGYPGLIVKMKDQDNMIFARFDDASNNKRLTVSLKNNGTWSQIYSTSANFDKEQIQSFGIVVTGQKLTFYLKGIQIGQYTLTQSQYDVIKDGKHFGIAVKDLEAGHTKLVIEDVEGVIL